MKTCCWLEASLNFNPCGAPPSAVVQGTQDYYCRRHGERMAAAGCVMVEVGEGGVVECGSDKEAGA